MCTMGSKPYFESGRVAGQFVEDFNGYRWLERNGIVKPHYVMGEHIKLEVGLQAEEGSFPRCGVSATAYQGNRASCSSCNMGS